MGTYNAYTTTTVTQLRDWLIAGHTVIFQNAGTWNLNYPGGNVGALRLGSGAKITKAANVGEVVLKMGTVNRAIDFNKANQWVANVIDDENGSAAPGMISAVDASNITIENVTIDGNSQTGNTLGKGVNLCVYFKRCSGIKLYNCIFRYGQSDLVRMRGCHDISVTYCTALYAGHEFVYTLSGQGGNTYGFIFSHNNIITRNNSGCRMSGNTKDVVVSYNTFDGTQKYGSSTGPELQIDTSNVGQEVKNITIKYNTFKNSRGAAIWCQTDSTSGNASGLYIYNNSFSNNGSDSNTHQRGAINMWQFNNVYIERNSFVNPGTGTALRFAVWPGTKAQSDSTYTVYFRHNTGTTATVDALSNHTIVFNGSDYTTPDSGGGTTPPPVTTITQPAVILTGVPSTTIPNGGTFTMTWSAQYCTSAVLERTKNGVVEESTPIILGNGTGVNGGTIPKVLTESTVFTIRGYNNTVSPIKTANASCIATVAPPTIPNPTAIFTVSKNPITVGEYVTFNITNAANTKSALISVFYSASSAVTKDSVVALDSNGNGWLESDVFTTTGHRTCILTLSGTNGSVKTYPISLVINPIVAPIPPTLTFTANYTTVDEGADVRLSWITTNATSLTLTPGGPQTSIASGYVDVKVFETLTYVAHAVNGTGSNISSVTKYITINVNPPPPPAAPTILLHTSADAIDVDKSVIVTWNVTMADTFTGDHGIGSLNNVSGSKEIFPTSTTTYEFVADGPGGTTRRNLTINVETGTIQSLFVASPANIYLGDSTTLAWMNRFGKTTTLSNGIGVIPSGSTAYGTHVVTPSVTTEYALTVSGSMGTDTKTFTVNVMDPVPSGSPWAHIMIDKPILPIGETATFTWTSDGATAMACGQDIGFVELPSGSLPVTPVITRTYQFVVADDDDSTGHDIEVHVVKDYEFIESEVPEYEESFIDMTARRVYVSGGQSTSTTMYSWDIDSNLAVRPNPDDTMITFAYDDKGYYMITLTSVDKDGEILKQTVRATVLE